MAEAQDDDEIFVYMGGNQQVPDGVRRARIHKSVKIVRARAFQYRRHLISVEFHDEVEIIEEAAFSNCSSFKGPIKLLGVKIVKQGAFAGSRLIGVEFGDKLETIETCAFNSCKVLRKIRIPSVRTIGNYAFARCVLLTDVEFGEALRKMQLKLCVFEDCFRLKRIAFPLIRNIIPGGTFKGCPMLTTVDLVGGIHNSIASLYFESWRNEMTREINRINQTLPTTEEGSLKTKEMKQWIRTVIRQLNYYKGEQRKLKEVTTLLELALWKANLDNEGDPLDREGVRRMTRGSRKRARKEICVTSGGGIVIKNVLPFLA